MKLLFILLFFTALFSACKNTQDSSNTKQDSNLLHGLWKIEYIKTSKQTMPGQAMGNPRYEFTKDGYRIKTLDTTPAPPPDSVAYKVENQQISYPANPKLPQVTITLLTNDSLVLKNDKVEWRLYK
ncbi:MAG: hypothetical protein MK212_09290 [Saprospiraceae bacterium]|nr:hypothetical protein [Saprospiraceae bacterium]